MWFLGLSRHIMYSYGEAIL